MDEFEVLKQAWDAAGLWGGAAAAAMLLIRWGRKDFVQTLLPSAFRWVALPMWARKVLVGVAALLSALVAALTGGVPLAVALVGAVPTVIGAVLGHKATKAVAESISSDTSRSIVTTLGILPRMKAGKLHVPPLP